MGKRGVDLKSSFIFVLMVIVSLIILYFASKLTIPGLNFGDKYFLLIVSVLIYLTSILYIILNEIKRKHAKKK
jgi:hypothetical protein